MPCTFVSSKLCLVFKDHISKSLDATFIFYHLMNICQELFLNKNSNHIHNFHLAITFISYHQHQLMSTTIYKLFLMSSFVTDNDIYYTLIFRLRQHLISVFLKKISNAYFMNNNFFAI